MTLLENSRIQISLCLEKFYPRDIEITWRSERKYSQNLLSSTETLTEGNDLKFNITSECSVLEYFFIEPHDELFYIISRTFFGKPRNKVFVEWKHESLDVPECRSWTARDFPWLPVVEDIQTPRLFLGFPVQMECKISGYFPDALTVNWLIVKGGSAEETLLPDTDSISITSKREADLTYSSTTSLTVTPSLETHQGAIIMCRVQHPSMKKPIERSTEALRVTAKPCLVEPVKMTLLENSEIQISLCLERFYPRDIEITWRSEGKYSQNLLSSTGTLTEGNDLTFNVTSESSVHEYFFIEPHDEIFFNTRTFFGKPRNKVFVEWKHESLDIPECRSWSARDLPWRPVMEDIIIPKLEAGKEAALSCKISGYFPDSLSVKWIKKEKGNKSEIKLPTGDYAIPYVKSNEEKNKTFTRETRLIFTPHPERDRGAEFICRVTHPTLEEPIEKRTGPLAINGRPEVLDIKLSRSGGMYLEVNKFYPRDIQITWRLDEDSGGNQCQSLSSYITGNGVNSDGTYNVTSTCDHLGDILDKSKTYYVKAFVKHVSLETEEQRSKILKN